MNSVIDHLGLPPADQIGLVVRNLDTAIRIYEPLFGPFVVVDTSLTAVSYRGRDEDVHIRTAFGHSGQLEIELIEWVSGFSPHREFIERGAEGMHHIRYRVDDADAWIARLGACGYEPIWYKRYSEDTTFAYLERPEDPVIIEFLQMPLTGPGGHIY